MLPFTKRAGRGPRDEDVDVVTKDDLARSSTLSSRPLMRPPAESLGDDDMTNIVSSKAIGHIIPAAGRPASQPPPSLRGSGRLPPSVRPPPPSVRPPPMSSSRAHQAHDDDQEDDDGRTAIRGAPRIVKRSTGRALANGQGQIAPSSVIKATLESARANGAARRDALLAGTPSDLRDETDDRLGFTESIRPDHVPFVRSAQPLQEPRGSFERGSEPAPQSVTPATGYGPPSSHPAPNGHNSYRPAGLATVPYQGPQVHAQQPNMALAQTAYASQPPPSHAHHMMGPASSRSAFPQGPFTPRSSPPGAPGSAPAHFMTPQNGRYPDPPGTAVTSGHRVPSGRPAASWAVALLACGLFVGVAAVAVTQGSETAADTTASFVDPSRTTAKVAAAQPAVPQQGGLIGASPVQEPMPAPVAAAPTMPGVFGSMPAAAPVAPAPVPPSTTIASGGVLGGFAPVAVAPVAVKAEPKEAKPAPRPTWHPAPRPAPAKVATNDEPKDPPATKKKAANAAPDDETKKALEALQKAQLDSSNSFGN